MNTGKKGPVAGNSLLQLVTFRIGREEFSLSISVVRDIDKSMRMTKVSEDAGFVEGIIDLQGHALRVIDLRRHSRPEKQEYDKDTIVVAVDIPGKAFGFLLDAVKEGVQALRSDDKRGLGEEATLFIKIDNKPQIIKASDVICIKAEGEYSKVFLSSGLKLLVRRLMKQWEKQLPGSVFLRIHRSTIININYVEKIEKWYKRSFMIRLKGFDEGFVISQRYFSKIKTRFLI